MKKIHFIIIFISLIQFLSPTQVFAGSINIPADVPYILIDSKTGQVLAEQNSDQKCGPASTTKIMTAILALENGNLDQEVTISQSAVYDIGRGGMNIGIMAGEKGLTLENMVNVLLIKSANEAANIIAENVVSSRSEFIDMMNRKAKEIGAVNTTFKNPSGKDTEKEDAGHLSTPADMAKIARYAMTIPKFREIVSTEYYKEMPATDKHDDWGILRNSNQLLWHDNTSPYTRNGIEQRYTVIGVKTGYTAAAGNNLVAAAVDEDGMELISVVMHVMQPNKIYGYTRSLLKYGFENFSIRKIASAGQYAAAVPVENALEEGTVLDLVTASDFSCVLPIDTDIESIERKVNVVKPVKAPVKEGDVLGNIEYIRNGTVLGKVDIVASKPVSQAIAKQVEATETAASSSQSYSYVLLGILLFLSFFIILRMTLRKISRSRKKKKYTPVIGSSDDYDRL